MKICFIISKFFNKGKFLILKVGAAEGIAPIRSRDAKLTVRVPPEPPVIINGAELRFEKHSHSK